MFTEDPQATVAFSPSPGALPRSAGEVFYAQTPLWTSLLAAFALKEQFSPTALLGVAAFTASLGVAACPDDVPRRGAWQGCRAVWKGTLIFAELRSTQCFSIVVGKQNNGKNLVAIVF